MFCFLGGCIVTRFCQWCSFKFECMQHKMYRSHHFTLICFIFTFVCGLAWFPYTHMWATIIVNSIIRYTCEYVSIRTTSRIQLEHWHLWHQNLRNGSLDLSELLWLGLNSQQVVFFSGLGEMCGEKPGWLEWVKKQMGPVVFSQPQSCCWFP